MTTPPATPAGRARVLVLDPTSKVTDDPNINPAMLTTLGKLIIVELAKDRRLDVVSAEDLKRLAQLESDRQALGCEGEAACLAELADAMGARYVVFGDVGKIGASVIVTLNLFDSQRATALNRATAPAKDVNELINTLPTKATELVAPLVVGSPDAARPVVAPAAPADEGGSVWPYVLIGGGLAVAALGLVPDLALPSSHNGRFDLIDVAGPVMYGAGAIAGGVGVVWLVME
jgi:TolB-like protein